MSKRLSGLLTVACICFSLGCNSSAVGPKAALEVSSKSLQDSVYTDLESHQLEAKTEKVANQSEGRSLRSITISNKGEQKWQGIIKVDYVIRTHPSTARFFLPGFMYGKNKPETPNHRVLKSWPRLHLDKSEIPFSSYFRVRGDRLSHPVAMIYANNNVYGIAGSPHRIRQMDEVKNWSPGDTGPFYRFNGFGCELREEESSISYTIGYENAPYLYICCRDNRKEDLREENTISLEPGESFTFRISTYRYAAENELRLNKIIKEVYQSYHQEPRKGTDPKTALADLAKALYEDAYNEEAKNYVTAVTYENGEVKQGDFYSVGWTGGMMIAQPMLMAATRLGNAGYRKQALEVIDNMVKEAMNHKSGLPFDAYVNGDWTTAGWWEKYVWSQEEKTGHSSYVGGQAIFYLLDAYSWEKEYNDQENRKWLDFAYQVSNQYEQSKLANGEYAYRISAKTGKGVEYDSFGGAWCLAARCYLYKISADSISKQEIDTSIRHYWDTYLSKMECYGTPHDVWKATDEEGILGFIKALKIMHEQTGESWYLSYLKDAIDYEFTWKYMYNTPVQIPPLNDGWSSSGASGTSVANPHVHPMGGLIADEVLYLAKQLNNQYYYARLRDLYLWGLQSYNRKAEELDFGKKGWMPERFCASEGLLIEKYPDGSPASTWFVYHPWAAASVVAALAGEAWDHSIDP